ncbi:glycosyltransferase [Desulfofundulus thermobenzoicus]|uniref:Glycosyltransferase n=1 Tax=Desulfofundulus thermobenzoicus TaxID=29376 RepID=A0A6N7ISD2_9FIRM|nr:glycosyltransferase [Desulfofundulus thermobenzoicus]MQL52463.1 glycosyltransferase [Desulfofundulus thermobenzoicus]HHW44398.1 glycosyltransferase [Desulfotomaculum sp.]
MAVLERVVILSVSAGMGHMRAAAAIKAAIQQQNPLAEVTILDTFRYTSPLLEKVILGTYMEMLKITPVVYGYLYRRAEKGQPLSEFAKQEFNRILNKLTAPRLVKFLQQSRPQLVVCTHPFPVGILDRLRSQGIFRVPVCATITDFTVHPFWVFPEVDAYVVATEDLRRQFMEYDFPVERVHATGIPIDPSFARPVDCVQVQQMLELDADRPTVLVMGGGLGMGPLAEAVHYLGNGPVPCQLLVVTGQNEQLRHRIQHMAENSRHPVRVFGFVHNIPELMSVAHLMVGKAGGLTCAEAMSRGLPMIIADPLPGQEERNTEYLCRAGAAVQVSRVQDLGREVAACLENKSRLLSMSAAAARLGRPHAARDAVDLMYAMLQSFRFTGSPEGVRGLTGRF